MGIFKLNNSVDRPSTVAMSGRDYFRKAAADLRIGEMDPVSIQNDLEPLGSQRGNPKSRVGGRIAWNLKHLTPQETLERAQRAERFLKQRPVVFEAEEERLPKTE